MKLKANGFKKNKCIRIQLESNFSLLNLFSVKRKKIKAFINAFNEWVEEYLKLDELYTNYRMAIAGSKIERRKAANKKLELLKGDSFVKHIQLKVKEAIGEK